MCQVGKVSKKKRTKKVEDKDPSEDEEDDEVEEEDEECLAESIRSHEDEDEDFEEEILNDDHSQEHVESTETSAGVTVSVENNQDEESPTQASEPVKEVKKPGLSMILEPVEPRSGVSLFDELWQPRRSERIFLNSSVTSTASASPLSSPGGKGDLDWTVKKPKKAAGHKKVRCP